MLAYCNINAGALTGLMAYDVYVEGPFDIVDVVTRIRLHDKGKLVSLRGNFTLDNSDLVYTLAKTLLDMSYGLAAWCDGQVYFPWMTYVKYLGVTTSKAWPGFACQEFRWCSKEEPVLPANLDSCNLFVLAEPEDAFAFVKAHAPRPWRILLATKVLKEDL